MERTRATGHRPPISCSTVHRHCLTVRHSTHICRSTGGAAMRKRLFAQVNQSEMLTEFLDVVLSPLRRREALAAPSDPAALEQRPELGRDAATGTAIPEIAVARLETGQADPAQRRSHGKAGDADTHLVMLVHGIRTRAPWYIAVRDLLEAEGFQVGLSNYGRFDLVRFLLPLPFLKAWTAADVERYVRAAMDQHGVKEVSVIAHSFGTYIVAWILRRRFDIKFKHIIFCGSVVKFRFPFEQLKVGT